MKYLNKILAVVLPIAVFTYIFLQIGWTIFRPFVEKFGTVKGIAGPIVFVILAVFFLPPVIKMIVKKIW